MTEPRDPGVAGERSLDPDEKWGQGQDLSHPESATGQPIDDRNESGDEPARDDDPTR